MVKKNTSSKKPTIPPSIPPATTIDKTGPFVGLHPELRELEIFRNNNALGLFYDLIRHAPNYTRTELFDKDELVLGPRQGVFAGRIFAPRMKLSRDTVWRLMRTLVKQGFIRRTLQQTYSIYTLTGKALPRFSKSKSNTPVNTPEGLSPIPPGAQSQESKVKSLKLRKTKRKVPRDKLKILIHQKDYLKAQGKILKSSLCSEPDLGLPEDVRTWLIAGICAKVRGECREGQTVCVPVLIKIAAKITGRVNQEPIRHPKTYIEQSVNEYFYPELFYEPEGGE